MYLSGDRKKICAGWLAANLSGRFCTLSHTLLKMVESGDKV